MMNINIDDDTADMVNQLSERQLISPSQVLINLLTEYIKDIADATAADAAIADWLNLMID
jgi:predicted transcriptional regulator